MTPEKQKVVVIHGSHKGLVDGKAKMHRVGDAVEMTKKELLELDPLFRNGIGERFASPEKADKLTLKRQLEAELDANDDGALESAAYDAEEHANFDGPDETKSKKHKKS